MQFPCKVAGTLLLIFLVVSLLNPFDAIKIRFSRRRRRRSPPVNRPLIRLPLVRRPPSKAPARLSYCPLDARVKSITEQKKFGRELQQFKRTTPWPYNCLYASILQYRGTFNYLPLIETCCKACSFPAFTTCVRDHGTGWRCPSQGLQCIVKCVRLHDPNTKTTTKTKCSKMFRTRVASKRLRLVPSRKSTTTHILNPKCERKVKKNGKDCIERLCIPIKLN